MILCTIILGDIKILILDRSGLMSRTGRTVDAERRDRPNVNRPVGKTKKETIQHWQYELQMRAEENP
jgi:hypothetical protein